MSATRSTAQRHNLTTLDTLLESCSESQLLAIIAKMIEYEPYAYQEMPKQELIAFIVENYNFAIAAEVYKDEDEFIDWCFKIALKQKALEMSERFNNHQRANGINVEGHCKGMMYYCCLVYSISYFIKDFRILDEIDHFVTSPMGYVSASQFTEVAKKFNLAIRVRIIPDGRDMIEYMNKTNDGWYDNPQTAEYCVEVAIVDQHCVPWIEDMGITEYYLEHCHDIDKYAESHGWCENKKYHTYKKVKNSFAADEKRKGMNVIRFMNKLVELSMTEPIKRNDKDYISYMSFQDFKYHYVHPRW